jgi:hypothetical protein
VPDAGGEDADVRDADADRGGDTDPDGASDAEPDGDGGCEPGEQLCGDGCVPEDDPGNCGACGVVCSTSAGCSCTGSPLQCQYHGGRACVAECPAGALLCAEECFTQPDETHCGSCAAHCDSSADCECRETDGGAFECLRFSGGDWVSC